MRRRSFSFFIPLFMSNGLTYAGRSHYVNVAAAINAVDFLRISRDLYARSIVLLDQALVRITCANLGDAASPCRKRALKTKIMVSDNFKNRRFRRNGPGEAVSPVPAHRDAPCPAQEKIRRAP